jgi:uncharacterized protein (DUF1810 family)
MSKMDARQSGTIEVRSRLPEMAADDSFDLQRFVAAQHPMMDQVLAELRRGHKTGHWMWFVFPQIHGLGRSSTAVRFALSSRREAQAYLQHPILGPRLRECTQLVTAVDGRPIREILGFPDDLKFHSSMTLFAHAAADNELFMTALQKYFAGRFDAETLARI